MTNLEQYAMAALQGLLAEPCSVGAPSIAGKLTAGLAPMGEADKYAIAAFRLARAMANEADKHCVREWP